MFQLLFDVLGEKGIIIIIRIVRITHAGTTLVSKLVAELVMGRVGYGPSLYGPSCPAVTQRHML